MNDARRRFSVSTPDWGEAHLTLDAIVAFVDDELATGAHARATAHLANCPECSDEVISQGQARSLLRSASAPAMPSSLLSTLRSIPQDADLPEPPAGLAMTADGEFVTVLRPVSPLARTLPAAPVRPAARRPAPPSTDIRIGHTRRLRLGAGAAVSGLALGALALAAPSASIDAPSFADRAALGGSLFGPQDALPAALAATIGPATDRRPPAAADPAQDDTAAGATRADTGQVDAAQTALTERLDTMAPVYFPSSGR